MKENTIKILKIEVGQPPQVKEIENSLKPIQKEVGGLMEIVYLDDGCLAVVNDEDKINGMQPNRRLGEDILCGPFFICGDDGEDFTSLSDEQIAQYSQQFSEIEQFTGDEPELEPRCDVIGFSMFGGM